MAAASHDSALNMPLQSGGSLKMEPRLDCLPANPDENPERFGIGQSFAKQRPRFSARDAKRARLEPPPSPPKELLGPNAPSAAVVAPINFVPASPLPQTSFPPPAIKPPYVAPVSAPAPVKAQIPVSQPAKSVEAEVQKKESADCVDGSGVFCKVCQIAVTSAAVMETHLKGVKHLKKLKSMGRMLPPRNQESGTGVESILSTLSKPPQQNDWSLYRMPSGKYYCKTCNSIMADEKLFSQHWYGKKHKLKVKQEMDELSGPGEKKQKGFYRRPFGKKQQ